MTILEFKSYFKKEVASLYSLSESTFILTYLLEKITGCNKYLQRKFPPQELLIQDEEKLKELTKALKQGQPYQQLLEETEFYGLLFYVNENVLIPRPETEELLELALQELSEKYDRDSAFNILEIGTGSGVIPIVLKKYFPMAQITSIDVSEKALEVAKINAENRQFEIDFKRQDYLRMDLKNQYDVIISNPPYIGKNEYEEISDIVKNYEPQMALFSPTSNPLIFYEKIAMDAKEHLHPDGLLFLEINQKLGLETKSLFSYFSEINLLKDLSGNDRFIHAVK